MNDSAPQWLKFGVDNVIQSGRTAK